MRIHIPAEGDRIRLISDWTFTLHREWRNSDLFHKIGWNPEFGRFNEKSRFHVKSGTIHMTRHLREAENGAWLFSATPEKEFDAREPLENIKVQHQWRGGAKDLPFTLSEDKHKVKVVGLVSAWSKNEEIGWWEKVVVSATPLLGTAAPVTLPAGSILTVHRIHIPRGPDLVKLFSPEKDGGNFPSITFLGEADRTTGFWAKMVDCNNIEFEPCSKEGECDS